MNSEQLLDLLYPSKELGDSALCAYTLKSHSANDGNYYVKDVIRRFEEIADILGYDITKREPVEAEAAE